MIRIYAIVAILGMLAIASWGAKYYYDTTQATIATLRENNAKLTSAIETSENSIKELKAHAEQTEKLTQELQNRLQTAERYGDNLRRRLRQLDLVGDAINDPDDLEGRMNRATAKVWRDINGDTGGSGDQPLPNWLQSTGTGSTGSDSNPEDNSTNSGETQAN